MTNEQEPVDAELVEDPPTTPVPAAAFPPAVPEPDYSEGGVPSLSNSDGGRGPESAS